MTNLTFDWQIDEFMVYCQSKQLRPKSMQSYEQALRLFERWCKEERQIEKVDEVKENDVRRYITDVQQRGKYTFYVNDKQKKTNHPEHRRDYRQIVSVGTINNYIRNLKVFFNWLDESYVLKKNPKAKSYLRSSSFSYTGLIDQLEYSGFTHEEAVYAVENCGADWDEQASKKAQSYLKSSSFSYTGLIEQMEFTGFTHEQAVKAVDNCGADWDEQASKKAQSYLKSSSFSYKGLIEQMEFTGFTHEQAVKAVDNCGADWKEQAVKKAQSYLKSSSFSKERLISQLEYSGFTHEQALYAVEQVG